VCVQHVRIVLHWFLEVGNGVLGVQEVVKNGPLQDEGAIVCRTFRLVKNYGGTKR